LLLNPVKPLWWIQSSACGESNPANAVSLLGVVVDPGIIQQGRSAAR
jgi:hypothetical protein